MKKTVSKSKDAKPTVTSIWSTVWLAASSGGAKGRKISQGQILEAAASTFLKIGYAKTTVADILNSASISRRRISPAVEPKSCSIPAGRFY